MVAPPSVPSLLLASATLPREETTMGRPRIPRTKDGVRDLARELDTPGADPSPHFDEDVFAVEEARAKLHDALISLSTRFDQGQINPSSIQPALEPKLNAIVWMARAFSEAYGFTLRADKTTAAPRTFS